MRNGLCIGLRVDTSSPDPQKNASRRTITEGAPKYCTDDASKKAVCQLKSLVLAKAVKPAKAEFTFKDGKGILTHDGQMYTGWNQMTRELDK